jgi:apolipoprotein N-acyltransferase
LTGITDASPGRGSGETNSVTDPDTTRSARSLRSRSARPALALGAGALTALSLPPWGFWPLAFIGVVLFDVCLGANPTRRERFRFGALFGAGWMYLGMGWMVQLTPPGYIAAGLIFTTFHSVAAGFAPTGRWRVIGRPAAHTLVEALRLSFPFGGVPLATLGVSQVGGPFADIAAVGGVILLTWAVFQIGFALTETASSVWQPIWRSWRSSPEVTPHRIGRIAVAVVIVLMLFAPNGSATGDVLSVAVVQGGGRQGTSALEVPSSLVTQRHLEATATIGIDRDVDFVLWPENTIDVDDQRSTPEFEDFSNSPIRDAVAAEAARLDAPIAVGITEDTRVEDPASSRYTNAQVVVTPDGEIVSRYDKVRRVPFGEYVPFRGVLEKISSAVDQVGEAVAGTERAFLDLPATDDAPSVRMATVISWEVFFGGRAREGVVDGATVIINPTNGASYTGTIVQTQQVASSRLRAIETGRWVIQAAPTGFSAIIDADGTVLQRTAVSEQRVLYADVPLRTGSTWYRTIGDGPFIVLFGLVFAASWLLARREHSAAV